MSTTTTTHRGLEDVIAGSSSICYIDGDNGILAYRGIDIHELADYSTFEEVTYLLWHGKLPTRAQLQEFNLQLARERKLDAQIISLLRQAPRHALPMDVLRTIVSSLSFFDPEENDQYPGCELPQGAAAVFADCHGGGGLRPDSQGQAAD